MRNRNRTIGRLPAWLLALLALFAVATVTLVKPAGHARAANSVFRLSAATYEGTGGSVIPVTVLRTGGTGTIDVKVHFESGTAVPGVDYDDPGDIYLSFPEGATSRSTGDFAPPALHARPGAGQGKTVNVTISIPFGQLNNDVTASPSTAVITINPSTLPTVTRVSPSSVSTTGGTVTLYGTNFLAGSQVFIDPDGQGNQEGCSGVQITGGTQIVCQVPPHAATTGLIYVAVPPAYSAYSNKLSFQWTNGPAVSSISPNNGPAGGGQDVVIYGSGFNGTTCPGGVMFGGQSPSICSVQFGGTQIFTRTPPHAAGVVDVVVSNANGTSWNTADDDYTYTGGPSLSSVVPAAGPTAGGNTVTLNGTNLTTATGVKFGDNSATVTQTGDTAMKVTVPAHSAGAVDVSVTWGGGTLTLVAGYTYTGGPTIEKIEPSSGPAAGGNTVTITGTGFATGAGATAVSFGGTPATSINVTTATTLTAVVPQHAEGVVDVIITVAGASTVNTPQDNYTYTANAPVVSSLNPTGGPPGGGNSVSIGGSGFSTSAGATTVKFGGVAGTSVNVTSTTSLTVIAPAGTGVVQVRVTVNGVESADNGTLDDYTYTTGPTITSVTTATGQASAPTTGGPVVTINGTNFVQTGLRVKFGYVDADPSLIVLVNSTQLTVPAPAHAAGTFDVRVSETVNGVASTSPDAGTADNFTFTATAAPAVSSLSPANGPVGGGNAVTITGTGFFGSASATVYFGTSPVAVTFTGSSSGDNLILSDTQIVVKAPSKASPGVVDVTVQTALGTSSSTGTANDYTYGAGGAVVLYTLYYPYSLITWAGLNEALILDVLRGVESPDNPATIDISSRVGAVYRWSADGTGCRNSQPSCWLGYFPGSTAPGVNDFTTFRSGVAYWVSLFPGMPTTSWNVVAGQ